MVMIPSFSTNSFAYLICEREDTNVRRRSDAVCPSWLRHAPKPPLRANNVYDAFISYRSSDRAWAMALYDVLKLGEWQAFLDQYDLVPGANLETSLTEALEASSAGVIGPRTQSGTSESATRLGCSRKREAAPSTASLPSSMPKSSLCSRARSLCRI
jgi:TIR domain